MAIPSQASNRNPIGGALTPNIIAKNHTSIRGKNNVRCNSEGSHSMMYLLQTRAILP